MQRVDKLAIAGEAIKRLPELARCGTYSPATGTEPACWECKVGEWWVLFAENVLLSPMDPAVSMLLDVWPVAGGGKVFSVSWMPDQPWLPPRVVRCKAGSWQVLLLDGNSPAKPGEADGGTLG